MAGISLLSLAGCQSTNWAAGNDTHAYPNLPDRHPSLALATPELASAIEAREAQSVQWYESRNDVRRSTSAGLQSPVYEREVTYIVDRQIQSGPHVRDYNSTTTYRQRYREAVR